jgi:hypothetical protein
MLMPRAAAACAIAAFIGGEALTLSRSPKEAFGTNMSPNLAHVTWTTQLDNTGQNWSLLELFLSVPYVEQ